MMEYLIQVFLYMHQEQGHMLLFRGPRTMGHEGGTPGRGLPGVDRAPRPLYPGQGEREEWLPQDLTELPPRRDSDHLYQAPDLAHPRLQRHHVEVAGGAPQEEYPQEAGRNERGTDPARVHMVL